MNQDNLRQQVYFMKRMGLSYGEIATAINVKQSTFYSWLDGNFNLKDDTIERLQEYINNTLLDKTPGNKRFKTVKNLINLLGEYHFDDDEVLAGLPQYDNNCRYYITNKAHCFSLCGKEWIMKKPQIDEDGYLYVDIYCNGERTRKRLHQLVIEAFRPNEDLIGKQIHHIDQNRQNNNLENLLVVSQKQHALIHKYIDKWRIDEL